MPKDAKELENQITQILKKHDEETLKINRYWGQYQIERIEEKTSEKIIKLINEYQ